MMLAHFFSLWQAFAADVSSTKLPTLRRYGESIERNATKDIDLVEVNIP